MLNFIKYLLVFVLIVTGSNVFAGSFSYNCSSSDVSCNDLFNDLITDKFTNRYDHNKYEIFVYSRSRGFSNGSGIVFTFVGVAPIVNKELNVMPNSSYNNYGYFENIGDAYSSNEKLKNSIRKAITSMMADCEETPNCNIN